MIECNFFPIDGREFKCLGKVWKAKLLNNPEAIPPPGKRATDKVVFEIEFSCSDGEKRTLDLVTSKASLRTGGKEYSQRLDECIEKWLSATDKSHGEVQCFGQ